MAAHKSSLITMLIFKSFFPLFKQQNFWVCPSQSVFARLAFCMPSAEIKVCLQTWADWKNIPIFYFLYDWLLGLLEDALSPFERPHSITITAAWHHMLCVAILCSGIFLVAAFRLTWLLLVYCYKGKILDCTPSMHSAGYCACGVHVSLGQKCLLVHVCRELSDLRAHSMQGMLHTRQRLLLPVCT